MLLAIVTLGDPAFAGPLTGLQLELKVYHVCEPEIKDILRYNITANENRVKIMTAFYFLRLGNNFFEEV